MGGFKNGKKYAHIIKVWPLKATKMSKSVQPYSIDRKFKLMLITQLFHAVSAIEYKFCIAIANFDF